MNTSTLKQLYTGAFLALTMFAAPAAQADPLTPVVIFPAFHFTRLEVTVNPQFVPGCPSGTFEHWFLNDVPDSFSQECKDVMLTLLYDPLPLKPMAKRFSNWPGVSVKIKHYGKTESAPYYEALYTTLEAAGYVRNQNIRVAGYDSRLTPDMEGFLQRTKDLIEDTYKDNGNTPVHLVAHSNGPLYTQYLLTHTSQAWKNKYIHGFTPFAGNWPGQGLFYAVFFTGFNVNSAGFAFPETPLNAWTSARMYQTHPSSYMSAADPDIFGNQEVVLETPSRIYTPEDNIELFQDAHLFLAKHLASYYTGFVKFADPAHFPNVDVYAEKASDSPTLVGAKLPNLQVGQVYVPADDNVIIEPGDGNQEQITNDAIEVWENMACFRFEFTDNGDVVDHFTLVSNPTVLQRLLTNLQRTRSVCP